MKRQAKTIMRIILIMALIVTYMFAERLLFVKTEHGIRQASEMYVQPENSIDVVFLGSSHVHTNINTAKLWTDYGIASYDYSGADQPIWMSYYYLKEICKYQTPRLVVLDLFSVAIYDTEYYDNFPFMSDNLSGMKFSANKLQMMQCSFTKQSFTEYFPTFITWHTRYKDLKDADIERFSMSDEDRMAFKGYTPYFGVKEQVAQPVNFEVKELEPKESEYLQLIKSFCSDNEIELMFVTAPHVEGAEVANKIYNNFEIMADEEGYYFLNGMKCDDEMGIDYSTDFNDESHLNYWGSCKYTAYLGSILKKQYEIPDRRGLELYESWNRNVEEVYERIKDAGYAS